MTDFWPDESENVWRMTDEAWSAYQAWKLSEEAPESAPVAPRCDRTPSGVGVPRIDRERSSERLTDVEEAWDFKAGCEKCDAPATHMITWHPVGRCTHPAFGGERLQHLLVCGFHLEAYEQKASVIVAEMNPPWWAKYFREAKKACPTCGKPVQLESDVLQVVVGL